MTDINTTQHGAASVWTKLVAVAALLAALAAGTLVAANGTGAYDTVAGGLIPVVSEGGDLGPPAHFAGRPSSKQPPGWPGENT